VSSLESRLKSLLWLTAIPVVGCNVDVEPYEADADTGSMHALVAVERTETAGVEQPRTSALAGFVRVPAMVQPDSVLRLVGLSSDLPGIDQCQSIVYERDGNTPLTPMAAVEFVEAGRVSLDVEGQSVSLAPNAFPTVTDLISGLVYTSRDRTAEPLLAASSYIMSVSGGEAFDDFEIEARAPGAPASVTVGGIPLADVQRVPTLEPVDLTWNVGQPDDTVYVELSTFDGMARSVCAFRDEAGAGTVPTGAFEGVGDGTLSIHRLRREYFEAPGVSRGEMRFDFELTHTLSFE
jgi:hypothetical protein